MNSGFDETKSSIKTDATLKLIQNHCPPPTRILVVGCGSGLEAGILARSFMATTVGIDIGGQFEFDLDGARPAGLLLMDARNLAFPDSSFDLVYSFHALEHIPEPERALAEMARVLVNGGTFFVGTPNRSRLLGYIGTDESLRDKILWNFNDWKMRIKGQWRNESGAHAGFEADQLRRMTLRAFGDAKNVTIDYYLYQYPRHPKLIKAIANPIVGNLIFPCVYMMGRRAVAIAEV
jgi:SAM-dependent methyltransferase